MVVDPSLLPVQGPGGLVCTSGSDGSSDLSYGSFNQSVRGFCSVWYLVSPARETVQLQGRMTVTEAVLGGEEGTATWPSRGGRSEGPVRETSPPRSQRGEKEAGRQAAPRRQARLCRALWCGPAMPLHASSHSHGPPGLGSTAGTAALWGPRQHCQHSVTA